ncbi:DnaD domain-containing protein [Niallia circulans]|uniref:DnaD domain-containing protein n=1 Tax=Niallia circulans TaxID=1397 RepID=UPI00163ADC22|nr:DnaD domain protein [Niallia circulans]
MSSKTKKVIIKEELVELTGDFKLAIVLNQMIYWSERKEDAEVFIKEEMARLQKYSDDVKNIEELSVNILESSGWIYKKAEDLSVETMINVKPKAMREYLKVLVANGWLDERRNPKLKMDRTLQYRVNILKIQLDLYNLGYSLEGYPLPVVFSEKENTYFLKDNTISEKENSKGVKENRKVEKESGKGEKERAIPEITSETTTEITSDNFEEEKESQPEDNPFNFYEQNGFGTIGSHISQKIMHWCGDLNTELVLKAMEIAVERGAKSFAYVESILRNWADKNIYSVQQADAFIQKYKEQQTKQRTSGNNRKHVRTEKIPEWFGNTQNIEAAMSIEEEKVLLLDLQEEIKNLRS